MDILYRSERVGKDGRPITVLKLRTFRAGKDGGSPTASLDDPRLTPWGKWLRRLKLDELPTLYNVLKGDLNLVGPRPDTFEEIASLDPLTRKTVLSVKPGLISPATLAFIDEDRLLKGEKNPHEAYCRLIKPKKYALNVAYVLNRSLWLDLKVILAFLLPPLRKKLAERLLR